ncbi:DUF4115 domain-containing protein [Spongiibacter sp. KMU-158]|uniref:DUF4115 domain-containing protein n=1 Tax=Spongiibacter pelagi TaxID=2760804 RepID=A0A927BZ80_9GAMM|nr:RodZ domain-containing protein [Spongiibacter pelagi]MBD2858285.1 DUF4115 domain-containing protein [Spongiibacter pelagi]
MSSSHPLEGPPGAILREARLQAGKSIPETADALNLLIRYVEALEDNDYSRFNSPLFAKGYIKAYARYLGLDEEPLLRDCERVCAREDKRKARDDRRVGIAKAPGNAPLIMAFVLALIIWILSVWFFTDKADSHLEVTLLEVIHPNQLENQKPESQKGPQKSPAPLLGNVLLNRYETETAQTLEPAEQAEGQLAEVRLHFSDTVWIELRDNNGNIVLSGVQEGGKDLRLTVLGPVELGTLNWPGVAMDYNNYPVKFERVAEPSSNNAIRVRIGEL